MASLLNLPRRVVTGHDAKGRAVVASDGPPPVIVRSAHQPGLAFYELWNLTGVPARVDNGADPTLGRTPDTHPPKGGVAVRYVDLPPEGPDGPLLAPEAKAQLLAAVGLEGAGAGRHPLMHRTESVDFGIVLAGECWLILEDGETHLKAGDVVVQRGTVHAWSNRSESPCRMAFILVDGVFAPDIDREDKPT